MTPEATEMWPFKKKRVSAADLAKGLFVTALNIPKQDDDNSSRWNERMFLRLFTVDLAFHWAILKKGRPRDLEQARIQFAHEIERFASESPLGTQLAVLIASRMGLYGTAVDRPDPAHLGFPLFAAFIDGKEQFHEIYEVTAGAAEFTEVLEAATKIITDFHG